MADSSSGSSGDLAQVAKDTAAEVEKFSADMMKYNAKVGMDSSRTDSGGKEISAALGQPGKLVVPQ